MQLMREYLDICISVYIYKIYMSEEEEGFLEVLPKRETSLDRYVYTTDRDEVRIYDGNGREGRKEE